MSEELFFIAGEQSGDLLGKELIASLFKHHADLVCYGVGGREMHAQGLVPKVTTIDQFQVMCASDVLKAAPRMIRWFRKIKKEILTSKPKAVIFIDYPDFNMLLAKSLRKNGYKGKLIHYVCPSVWAWRRKRIQTLARDLDLLLSILPFEKQYFSQTKLTVEYVGHPLVSMLETYPYAPWEKKYSRQPYLAIFPGSRGHEIEHNLTLQLKAVQGFLHVHKDFVCGISCARPDLEPAICQVASQFSIPYEIVPHGFRYELMRASQLAIATSGTVILELALHQIPTVATYRLSLFNYLLGRYLFRVHLPFYTLANIILGRQVYPEFVHRNISESEIVSSLEKLHQDRDECQRTCSLLKTLLTGNNASDLAAQKILHHANLN